MLIHISLLIFSDGLPVGSQNDCASFFYETSDYVPQESASFWIHTCGRFVLKRKIEIS